MHSIIQALCNEDVDATSQIIEVGRFMLRICHGVLAKIFNCELPNEAEFQFSRSISIATSDGEVAEGLFKRNIYGHFLIVAM